MQYLRQDDKLWEVFDLVTGKPLGIPIHVITYSMGPCHQMGNWLVASGKEYVPLENMGNWFMPILGLGQDSIDHLYECEEAQMKEIWSLANAYLEQSLYKTGISPLIIW